MVVAKNRLAFTRHYYRLSIQASIALFQVCVWGGVAFGQIKGSYLAVVPLSALHICVS